LASNKITKVGEILQKSVASLEFNDQGRDLQSYGLVHVYEGSGFYWDANGFKTAVKADDVLLLFPGLNHRYGRLEKDKIWAERYIVFEGPVFDQLEKDGVLDRSQPIWNLKGDRDCAKEIQEFIDRSNISEEIQHPYLAVGRCFKLLCDLRRLQGEEDSWIQRACRMLNSDLKIELSSHEVAQALDLGEQTFRKNFKQVLGLSPHQYRLQKRLEKAQNLLLEQAYKIVDVAEECGFCDPYHFSRLFKKHLGLTPGAFKKLNGISSKLSQH
jgi:AraC-like DNA-binding protein